MIQEISGGIQVLSSSSTELSANSADDVEVRTRPRARPMR